MKALVLGAGGQLGSELKKLIPDAAALTRAQLSVSDLAALNSALPHYRPDVVFNCAAYNGVDTAEGQQDAAYQVNAQGAFNVALACAQQNVRLVHFSTNFVFDGALDRPYIETDEVGPLGVYAKSKLEGEKLTAMVMPRALVIRTAALFGGSSGQGRTSFPERILQRAMAGERLRVVSDQTVNPTYAADLAAAAMGLASSDLEGVVHVVNAGCATWDELARATLTEFGVAGEVEPVSTAELGAPARRPANGCLESMRTQALRPWREALSDYKQIVRSAPKSP
ncbi:MAG: dTDP-4-dehydrorhamnose reductase [Chloroflexi bacterium 13_1_40CM_3_65_12]|nr:MAG: dTDP-4-dehydrorhamnose reductase [Chloroflexi bacterium 13_1_40CM_65_17]OLC66471.1 MAG: dTDP-4-dehydrorhamnose reductase [Actinobacteria bacterium 13_1_40CM_4_65_12]OLD24822.1 MAG: dTDP-4-dehydrorhamnose reductase [Chloroflexi bacterium 13_1_40CM_3_65_12]